MLSQLRSGVKTQLYQFGKSVDGLRGSRSFGYQSDGKPAGTGHAIPVAGDRSDDYGNFHIMPLFLNTSLKHTHSTPAPNDWGWSHSGRNEGLLDNEIGHGI